MKKTLFLLGLSLLAYCHAGASSLARQTARIYVYVSARPQDNEIPAMATYTARNATEEGLRKNAVGEYHRMQYRNAAKPEVTPTSAPDATLQQAITLTEHAFKSLILTGVTQSYWIVRNAQASLALLSDGKPHACEQRAFKKFIKNFPNTMLPDHHWSAHLNQISNY